MSRTAVPLRVDDLSPFAKTLRQSLGAHDGVPSHVELLNMLAKAAGFANYQHLQRFVDVLLPERTAPAKPIEDLTKPVA